MILLHLETIQNRLLENKSARSHQDPETIKYDEPGSQHDTEQHLDTGAET